jgi:Family of unknown function (DUF5946)
MAKTSDRRRRTRPGTPIAASQVSEPTIDGTACSGCGLVVEGGVEGCQAIFDDESAREYADIRFAARRRMVVDTYCLQHPERYCASAISLAAHLTGLCIAMEHRGREEELNAAIQRWLSRRPELDKPPLPRTRGPLTIAAVRAATDLVDHRAAVDGWARGTWDAYAALHPIARAWVARVAG